ncbi:hypothetical protein GCM10010464_43320 [Pseudonocardia yunnanensis]|uniref:Permease n=1 Tax=Pseudonocardia yunnanensis TaxID=58107 RepID=A0ABW4F754_9PSEU
MATPDETGTSRTDVGSPPATPGIPQQRPPSEAMTPGGAAQGQRTPAGGAGYAPDAGAEQGPPAGRHAAVSSATDVPLGRDRVRWGPVWAGVIVALAVFVVLQLFFFAVGVLGPGYGGNTTGGIVSGVLALVSFFIGGLLASASTAWRGTGDGLLHGVLVWALSMLGILVLALIGGSSVLGPLATLLGAQQQGIVIDPVLVLRSARNAAGWAALGLGLSVAAAAIGGVVGSKMWPRRTKPVEGELSQRV